MQKLMMFCTILLLAACTLGGSINASGGSGGVGVGVGVGTGIRF